MTTVCGKGEKYNRDQQANSSHDNYGTPTMVVL
jgi:hypothetical protein